MLEFIVPALQNLLNIQNLLWINLGVFIGSVFAAIPGLTVILCIILFPGFALMFRSGFCAKLFFVLFSGRTFFHGFSGFVSFFYTFF